MSKFTIDINTLLRKNGNKLFSGRSNGNKAFEYFKLTEYRKGDRIMITVPEEAVISSSYFLGMLEKVMMLYTDLQEYNDIVDTSSLSDKNIKEYNRAIKNGFFENTGFF